MIVTIITALLNGLAAVLPQVPGLIAEIKGSSNLTAAGAALLDRLTADEAAVEAVQPLVVPDPKPTAPA